jgi:hypothetical protein
MSKIKTADAILASKFSYSKEKLKVYDEGFVISIRRLHLEKVSCLALPSKPLSQIIETCKLLK